MCVWMKGPEKFKQQIIKRHSHNIKTSINSSINKEKKRTKKGRLKRFDNSSRGADGCEHRHPSVLQFRLATPAEGLYIAILGQAKRIEVSQRSLARHRLGRDLWNPLEPQIILGRHCDVFMSCRPQGAV